MRINISSIYGLIFFICWVMGTVIAFDLGFWHGVASIFLGPFYSWYLVVKHIMVITGFYPHV